MLTKRSTAENEPSNRHMLITFAKLAEHPKEIIRDEILMLPSVEKVQSLKLTKCEQ